MKTYIITAAVVLAIVFSLNALKAAGNNYTVSKVASLQIAN